MEDDCNGRQHQWKTTSIEADLMVIQLQWKTTSMENVPQWKTPSIVDNLNGR